MTYRDLRKILMRLGDTQLDLQVVVYPQFSHSERRPFAIANIEFNENKSIKDLKPERPFLTDI